jgi:hypothetical protein
MTTQLNATSATIKKGFLFAAAANASICINDTFTDYNSWKQRPTNTS